MAALPVPQVLKIRCHYCSQFRDPREVHHLPGGVVMCWNCYGWHQRALRMLAGSPPPGCQACDVTFKELTERSPDGNTRMYLHVKDGIYQVLCTSCSDEYERKRLDLYGDTVHGWLRKLKGAK